MTQGRLALVGLCEALRDAARAHSALPHEMVLEILVSCGGCLQALLEFRASHSAADNDAWTALISAANGGHTGCVEALLQAGADVGALTSEGESALDLASGLGHTSVVELLAGIGESAIAEGR